MVELLLETIDNAARHANGGRGSMVREVVRIIESGPGEDFRIKELARLAGYSLSWFKMRFKEETGVSPRQFILRTKIDIACRRLASSEDSIGKIAGELGFPNAQYFATVFRRLDADVSPAVSGSGTTSPRPEPPQGGRTGVIQERRAKS